jgi:hypothetical protein
MKPMFDSLRGKVRKKLHETCLDENDMRKAAEQKPTFAD